jgi:hypothetical protein
MRQEQTCTGYGNTQTCMTTYMRGLYVTPPQMRIRVSWPSAAAADRELRISVACRSRSGTQ